VLKALRAVLPREMPVLPVGGITPNSLKDYWEAGGQRFRTRFGAVQTGRYGGKGRAVGGGFQVRASRPAEKKKTVNIVNVVNIVTAEDSKA